VRAVLLVICNATFPAVTPHGKLKASQNQPEQNRAGVKSALASAEGTLGADFARLMR
jgi:predicted FMN-binding regulatory protein PaiB